MGSGAWSASTYAAATTGKIKSGSTFGYSRSTASSARSSWKAHEDLDPKKVAGPTSPYAGEVMRESRDNDEHPNSVPIAVFFDETGSMGSIPRVVQEKLGGLFTLLLRKGYVEDPQLMVGAYGDVYTDQVPLQVGQFESDNRVDDTVDQLFLEGNGGGNGYESQSLVWYYMAHHTSTDSFEKRNKKGYLFLIADEITHDITADQVRTVTGVAEPKGKLGLKELAQDLTDKWEVFILLIDNFSAEMQGSHKFYSNLFGSKRILTVEDPNSIAETIALAVGAMEGNLDLDDAEDDLKDVGAGTVTIRSATNSVAGLRDFGPGALAKTDADLGLVGASGSSRL